MSITMRLLLLLSTVALAVACSSKIEGEIKVNDQVFEIERCRSGQALGFSGLQLNGKDGRNLRLFAQPDGSTRAALLPADGDKVGVDLGNCGVLQLKAQSSRINNITNLEGSTTLECEKDGVKVAGKLKFENCH